MSILLFVLLIGNMQYAHCQALPCSNDAFCGENLVFNSNFDLGDVGFNNSFEYTSSFGGCLGKFFVDTSTLLYSGTDNDGTVWDCYSDHTGNPNGKFAFFDGSCYAPEQLMWERVEDLPLGERFRFEFWVANLSPSQDTIRVTVKRNSQTFLPLQAIAYEANQNDKWKKVCVEFVVTSPGMTSLQIFMGPSTQGVSSNDCGLDDVALYSLDAGRYDIAPVVCDSFVTPSGSVKYASGQYQDTVVISNGCDSIFEIDLTVNNSFSVVSATSACDSFVSPNGNVYQSSGTYAETLQSITSCDSVVEYQLTIHSSVHSTENLSACDSLDLPSGTRVYQSGLYTDNLQTIHGCDSILDYQVTIDASYSIVEQVFACDSFVSPSGQIYHTAGSFTEVFQRQNTCDSTIQYDVVLYPSFEQQQNITSCDSFVSPSGQNYLASGTYEESFQTVEGCDSSIFYDLTINTSDQVSLQVTACDSFLTPSGTYETSSGMTTILLVNQQGCDSIVEIHFDIYPSYHIEETYTGCDSVQTPDGQMHYNSTTTQQNLSSVNGCDSIVNYTVEVYSTESTVLEVSACDSFANDQGAYYQSGIFEDTLQTINGCDSLVELNLTLHYSTFTQVTDSSCGPYQFLDELYFEETGIYNIELQTQHGCDSIVELDLTVQEITAAVTYSDSVLTAVQDSATYQWIDCKTMSPITGDTNQTYKASQNGEYAVVVSIGFCSDTSECFELEDLNSGELESTRFTIYPNPASTLIVIDRNTEAPINYLILDATGRVVLEGKLLQSKEKISVASLSFGYYTIKVGNQNLRFVMGTE